MHERANIHGLDNKGQASEVEISDRYITAMAEEYNTHLPHVRPSCRAMVVIPVYKEFEYGRLATLLDELSLQEEDFETILVVNNPAKTNAEFNKNGYLDNCRLVNYVAKQQEEGRLANVRIIDRTNGQLGSRHLGAARGLGNEIGRLRLEETTEGSSGVLVQLDADVSVAPDFLSALLAHYDANPEVDAIKIPRIPLQVDYSSEDMYLGNAQEFVQSVLLARKGGFDAKISGPTLSFRSRLHKESEYRQYIYWSANEDYRLGLDVSYGSRFALAAYPQVIIGDRKRADGFDANSRIVHAVWKMKWRIAKDLYAELQSQFPEVPQVSFPEVLDTFMAAQQLAWCTLYISGFNDQLRKQFYQYQQTEEKAMRETLNIKTIDQDTAVLGTYLFAFVKLLMGDQLMKKNPRSH